MNRLMKRKKWRPSTVTSTDGRPLRSQQPCHVQFKTSKIIIHVYVTIQKTSQITALQMDDARFSRWLKLLLVITIEWWLCEYSN
jgi:hypothetical protein